MTHPTVAPQLRDLILHGLSEQYISRSCHDSIETGNHYQSVTLGDVETTGFRSHREELLDDIRFDGKSVLDLGSNLGELSRAARRRGAYLVDGIEYDPFFVELANAINAYNGTTRVSFYEGDITDRSTYRESYDIVLAFSVFIYIGQIMDMISLVTRDVLVLETHRLDGNLDATYLKTISPFFPHHRLVGDSEWGLPHGGVDRRAILAFAKSKHVLDSIVPELLGATAVS